jgi:hypothetical protein
MKKEFDDMDIKNDMFDDKQISLDVVAMVSKKYVKMMLSDIIGRLLPEDLPNADADNPSMYVIVHKENNRPIGFDVIHRGTKRLEFVLQTNTEPMDPDFYDTLELKVAEIRANNKPEVDLDTNMSEEELKERLKHAH